MLIEMKNGNKSYGSGEALVKALDDVSLSLDAGKIIVILGPSGSGKSTLLNMLGGIDSLDSGSLMIDGNDLTKMKPKEKTNYRKEKLGFVFQFYNLINDLSGKENIEVVSSLCKNPLDINKLMEDLEISNLKNRFPKEMSGGQQQRIAIARAMVKNPKLLLCDELTGALDSKSSKSVLEAIENLNKIYHTTIIIITHNEKISLMADQVVMIHNGKITSNLENKEKKSIKEIEL